MEKIFLVKLKFYKFRDLSTIDRRIICANNPIWEQKAKLFRHKLASEEKLYEVFHDYYVTGGYCLTEIPIKSNANVLLVCNNGNHNQQYLPIKIRFYNDQNKFIHSSIDIFKKHFDHREILGKKRKMMSIIHDHDVTCIFYCLFN